MLEQHGQGPPHWAAKAGETLIELYPATAREGVCTSTRLGFSVPSVQSALDGLQALGAEVERAPRQTPWGLRALVLDPDGHKIELSEG